MALRVYSILNDIIFSSSLKRYAMLKEKVKRHQILSLYTNALCWCCSFNINLLSSSIVVVLPYLNTNKNLLHLLQSTVATSLA